MPRFRATMRVYGTRMYEFDAESLEKAEQWVDEGNPFDTPPVSDDGVFDDDCVDIQEVAS